MNEKTVQNFNKERKKWYKKWWLWAIIAISIIIVIIFLMFIFKNNTNKLKNAAKFKIDKNKEYISEDIIDKIYVSTKPYVGKNIKLTGKVFNVNHNSDGTYSIQIYRNIINSDQNTIIMYLDETLNIKEGDFIKIDGCIFMDYEYENIYGGILQAPVIIAYNIEKSTYKDIVSPTIKEIAVNKTINQKGCKITISKIELAEKETRVYVTINNSSKYNFSFYKYESKITQGQKQYEHTDIYEANYEEIQTQLLPGIESSGIVTFPAIDLDKNFDVILDGSSDNWDWDIDLYKFTIKVN